MPVPDPGDLTIHLDFGWWTALGTLLGVWAGLLAGASAWLLRRLKGTFVTKKEFADGRTKTEAAIEKAVSEVSRVAGIGDARWKQHEQLATDFHDLEREHDEHLVSDAVFHAELKKTTDQQVQLYSEINASLSGIRENLSDMREDIGELRGAAGLGRRRERER